MMAFNSGGVVRLAMTTAPFEPMTQFVVRKQYDDPDPEPLVQFRTWSESRYVITTPVLKRSTASAAWAALVRVNFMVSMAVLSELAAPTMSPRMLNLDEVSSKPPITLR